MFCIKFIMKSYHMKFAQINIDVPNVQDIPFAHVIVSNFLRDCKYTWSTVVPDQWVSGGAARVYCQCEQACDVGTHPTPISFFCRRAARTLLIACKLSISASSSMSFLFLSFHEMEVFATHIWTLSQHRVLIPADGICYLEQEGIWPLWGKKVAQAQSQVHALRYGRPLLNHLHHFVVLRAKQFLVDICQRLLEQLVLFTEQRKFWVRRLHVPSNSNSDEEVLTEGCL